MLRIKRVHSEALRDEVYTLRYRAYLREGAIEPCTSERFIDKYDDQPNHILWALTEHERVTGSIRTTWYDPAEPWTIPEMDGYGEDVSRIIPQHAKNSQRQSIRDRTGSIRPKQLVRVAIATLLHGRRTAAC